jgi:uncharacterized protein involved in exopolysaccharide biosynthesis
MEEINLTDYFLILIKRRRTLIKLAFFAVLISGILLFLTPSTYRGRALLIFPEDKKSGASGLISQLAGLPSISDLVASGNTPGIYTQVLNSRNASQYVANSLGLSASKIDYGKLQKQLNVSVNKDGAMEICCYAPSSWVKSNKINWLDKKLPKGSINEKTAVLAAEMTNRYIQYLRDFDKQHSLTTTRRNREFLETEVEKTKKQLSEDENALRKFKETHPVVPPSDTISQQIEQVIDIRTKQLEAETALNEANRSVQEARVLVDDQDTIQSAIKVIQENPVVSSLKQDLAKAEVNRAQLLENMTENHPSVVAITEQIAEIRQKISEEVAQVTTSETLQLNPTKQVLVQQLATLEIGRSGVEARHAALKEVMSNLEKEISSLAKDQMTLVRLSRDAKASEIVYTSLLTELSRARVAESKEPDGFTVVDEAVPEGKRFKPKRLLTITAALFFGLIIGSFIAILQEGSQLRKGKGIKL